MTTPRTLLAVLLAALGLAAGRAFAAEPAPDAVAPPSVRDGPSLDLSGRLRATGDGLLLEIGGTRLELRVAGDGPAGGVEPFADAVPGAHELRARFSLDGRTTGLLLRFVPPPRSDALER